MIYKFKSKATGDVIMLGPQGAQLLQLLGRSPEPKGIIEPAGMPAAMAALEAAVAAAEQAPKEAQTTAADRDDGGARNVGLRARVWPMVEMLRRAQAAGEPVVWGV